MTDLTPFVGESPGAFTVRVLEAVRAGRLRAPQHRQAAVESMADFVTKDRAARLPSVRRQSQLIERNRRALLPDHERQRLEREEDGR